MLDLAPEDTSLEAKRRELESRIAEGHQVVDALMGRQVAVSHKIEEALDGLQRLQHELNGMEAAAEIEDRAQRASALQLVETAATQPSQKTVQSQPFRPLTYLKCLGNGHDFTYSRSMPGYVTCRRCRLRRRA